ncbi:DNA-binding transcriptional regulator, LysR family [Franzmannia pantelleriensis]|uniref:DNA-binding transcriptional regulator, LysR family n=1 Tax=Franzmannia pantelleriensis TaxID=48727 RepID=A0A1G9IK14_9GAMM|nr:LysR family transcriptional regulator [Halomonas pantelleriensis]SDL25561.1 DNA-binding transcriptional regulator, LysR family [Halomonas pantelleriensis]
MRSGFGFDLRSMEIFVETLEQGSQSAAARRLGLKQSSVSQSLATLEEGLGVSLFKRNARPLEPTTAGRFFYDRARRLLDEARSTRRELVSGALGQLHQVRLALVDSLATAVGQPLIELIRRHTRDYTLTTGLSHMHSHALLTRHVDIIVSDDRLENYDGLERHAVLREPFVLVAPVSWSGPLDNLRWLARQLDFVRYTPQSLIGQAIERHLRLNQLELPARLHLDNTFAVLRLVSAGAGWTITTPLCLFQAGLDTLQVRVAPLPIPSLQRELTLVARRDELGDLPAQLARDARRLLELRFRQELERGLPWLSSEVSTQP